MFEKVKNLRGILYKKMKEEEKRQITILPGFSIQKPVRIVEFPTIEEITKINITYPLMEPFAYAHIFWKPENKEVIYEVVEPQLSNEEKDLLKKISDGLVELVEVDLSAIKETGNATEYLQKKMLRKF